MDPLMKGKRESSGDNRLPASDSSVFFCLRLSLAVRRYRSVMKLRPSTVSYLSTAYLSQLTVVFSFPVFASLFTPMVGSSELKDRHLGTDGVK